jgi:hypothetical protein
MFLPMPLTCGRGFSKNWEIDYPDVERDYAHVDAICMWMVKNGRTLVGNGENLRYARCESEGTLGHGHILVAPAAFDMVSAKVIESAGFEAVYLSGFGQSASHLGLPDAGLMTLSEIVERVHNMARAIKVPLLADGDTGYGGVINVRRTVEEFEWAGASAIQLEDQEIPKKCGHTEGKKLIDARRDGLENRSCRCIQTK